jgi:DNA-binding PadR family transcriptional regulator
LNEFLEDPAAEQYGFGLMRATGLASGSLYPILDRLERIGWIDATDEAIDERVARRPRRRLYRLTPSGEIGARSAVVEFCDDLRWIPRWTGGLGKA